MTEKEIIKIKNNPALARQMIVDYAKLKNVEVDYLLPETSFLAVGEARLIVLVESYIRAIDNGKYPEKREKPANP